MKTWLRHFLPFGAVRASQLASEMADAGVARRHALAPRAAYRWKQLNFDLLPRGALRDRSARIIDIGANVGDWTADVLWVCPSARVTCIEPDPKLAAQLRARFAQAAGVEVIESAVGDRAGTIDFHLMESSVLNSVRTPNIEISGFYPSLFQVRETVTVPVQPLDAILAGSDRIALLKIDVQGYEREVLAGAMQTLQRTDHVLLEANFRTHYDGEASFFELDSIMQRHGFALGNYSEPKGGRKQALYADVLYVRTDP
jgi:FkbM family methyltransferase